MDMRSKPGRPSVCLCLVLLAEALCFCPRSLLRSGRATLACKHRGTSGSFVPSPAAPQLEKARPGTESWWPQGPWPSSSQLSRAVPLLPVPPRLPASRFFTPGSSSLLAEAGMTDGNGDVSRSRLPDFIYIYKSHFPLRMPNLATCHSSCKSSKSQLRES